MKKKSWIALSLALTMAGGGTGILAQVTQAAQNEEIELVIDNPSDTNEDTNKDSSEDISQAAANTELPSEAAQTPEDTTDAAVSETDPVLAETNDNMEEIELVSDEELAAFHSQLEADGTELTEADMSIYDVICVMRAAIEKEFGDVVSIIGVSDIHLSESYFINDHMYRAYMGVVVCEGDIGYSFSMDSITGQIYSLEKIENCDTFDLYVGEELMDMIGTHGEKYKKIATEFVRENLGETEDDIEVRELAPGSSAGSTQHYNWNRNSITAYCVLSNGHAYDIWIDPATDKVFLWSAYDSNISNNTMTSR